MAHDNPIGVFDSGVGGLTVLRALVDELPHESMVYLGDTARVPYGNRGAETVRRYALNAAKTLFDYNIKALVVACNTASAHALDSLQRELDIPVFGVVEPVARRAIELSASNVVGVIGTRGTINSLCYPDAIRAIASDAQVYQTACPLLVPLAEEGWIEGDVTRQVVRHYLDDFKHTELDSLILGCTHYPILKPTLRDIASDLIDPDLQLLDSASATAGTVADMLRDGKLAPAERTSRTLDFLLTDVSPMFAETAERFFGTVPGDLRHIDITT